jgi:hypothetical protein
MKNAMLASAVVAISGLCASASASFHLMQIEQVTLALDGDTTVQAVQLRMRSAFQNQMQFGRLVVRDAAGLNPIIIHDFTTAVPVSTSGSRVLVASDAFLTSTVPPAVRNYPMTNLVPASHIAAGKITFEQDNGTILWSMAWGGTGYTGTNSGATTNDSDGNFSPVISGAFPTAGTSALRFNGTATALSTNNAAQYNTVSSNVTFTNNAGANFVLTLPPEPPCFADYNQDGGVDGADVSDFFMDWSSGSPNADANLDGGVDGADVEIFFEQWSAGGC